MRYDIIKHSKVTLEGYPMAFTVEKHHGVFVTLRDTNGQRIPFDMVKDLPDFAKYSIGEVKCHEKYVLSSIDANERMIQDIVL